MEQRGFGTGGTVAAVEELTAFAVGREEVVWLRRGVRHGEVNDVVDGAAMAGAGVGTAGRLGGCHSRFKACASRLGCLVFCYDFGRRGFGFLGLRFAFQFEGGVFGSGGFLKKKVARFVVG